jgi:hypothetical protein
MQAYQGYFDGESFKPLEHIPAKPNQRVIITVMDEYVEPDREARVKSMRGALSHYANPALIPLEKSAWESAAVEKHDSV